MADLETDLRALAAEVMWPETPDLRGAVLAQLTGTASAAPPATTDPTPRWAAAGGSSTAKRRRGAFRRRRQRRLLAAALAAVVLVPAAGAVAFPTARDEALEWLGLRNVTVRRVPTPQPAARPELEADLGKRVTLAQAEREAGFRAHVPRALGAPDRVRVISGRISLIYAPRSTLPRLGGMTAGLILTQTPGGLDGAYLEKLVAAGTDVERVRVARGPAAFISGGSHAYIYETPRGDVHEAQPLLAGPTLIWEQGGLVLRLETRAGKRAAVRIARSTR